MTYQVQCLDARGNDIIVYADGNTDEQACREALAILCVNYPGRGWQAHWALPYDGPRVDSYSLAL